MTPLKDDNDQDTGTERATHQATAMAAESQAPGPVDRSDRELPQLGEMDGEFYLSKRVGATDGGEPDEKVHADNAEEVKLVAVNNGWVPTGDVRVAEQRDQGDAWEIHYAVPVRANDGTQEG